MTMTDSTLHARLVELFEEQYCNVTGEGRLTVDSARHLATLAVEKARQVIENTLREHPWTRSGRGIPVEWAEYASYISSIAALGEVKRG